MMNRIFNAIFASPRSWLFAGIAGAIVLTIFMEGVARVMLGAPMKPAILMANALGWGAGMHWLTEIVHYALALIFFPIGYVVFRAVTGLGNPLLSGIIWGVVLWLGAAFVLAPMAGAGVLFGGGKMMMASLIAHLAYGAVIGLVYGKLSANAVSA